jgi:hypothetical protein
MMTFYDLSPTLCHSNSFLHSVGPLFLVSYICHVSDLVWSMGCPSYVGIYTSTCQFQLPRYPDIY